MTRQAMALRLGIVTLVVVATVGQAVAAPSRQDTVPPALRVLAGPIEKRTPVAAETWCEWSSSACLAAASTYRRIVTPGGTFPQHAISLDALDRDTRRLVNKLTELSTAPSSKFRRKSYQRGWEADYAFWAPISLKNGMAASDLRQFIANMRPGSRSAEVGAWRITLTSGKVLTALHSSGREQHIDSDAVLRSLKGLLRSVGGDQVANVQYFHTHPDAGPLSSGDVKTTTQLRRVFAQGGVRAPIHMYSISKLRDDARVIFHLGLPALRSGRDRQR